MTAKGLCRGCGNLHIVPAADKNGCRYVYLRCMAKDQPFVHGRVLAWVKEEYADDEAGEMCRPAWCGKEV